MNEKLEIVKCGEDDSFWHWLVPSESVKGLRYQISIRKDTGNLLCECPDFQMRLKEANVAEDLNPCKHINTLKRHLAEIDPAATNPMYGRQK